jgi:hypothetical protein
MSVTAATCASPQRDQAFADTLAIYHPGGHPGRAQGSLDIVDSPHRPAANSASTRSSSADRRASSSRATCPDDLAVEQVRLLGTQVEALRRLGEQLPAAAEDHRVYGDVVLVDKAQIG